ncbi:hypothetical protein, partial [Aeromonas rivipollensis]|uniref:hypothetical protein n=1 Tax=Aeromonas rivipollensis TaxID=948519 RepID=UPI002979CC2B|nr:hypothetical protein [Aeromonas rivipollensis]
DRHARGRSHAIRLTAGGLAGSPDPIIAPANGQRRLMAPFLFMAQWVAPSRLQKTLITSKNLTFVTNIPSPKRFCYFTVFFTLQA